MDPKIVKDLHDAFRKGMNEPSFTAMLAQFDQEPFYMNSEDYRSYALKKIEEEKRLVLTLGLKAE